MGVYRLILAYMVVIGHTHQPIAGTYGVGIAAVISFFLISGFVMTGLVRKYYLRLSAIPSFYSERFLRLAPQFYFYSFLTLVLALFGLRHDFMQQVPSFGSIVMQFLAVPLDFYRYFSSMLLPQAWSLGLEIMFYLAFPIILIFRLRLWFGVGSILVYICAFLGLLDTDLWGYRYLPGTLFIFICGSYMFSHDNTQERRFITSIWLLCLVLLFISVLNSRYGSLYTHSVLMGIVLGIPIVKCLGRVSVEEGKGGGFDNMAGNLSYGVFLNHMLIIGAFQTWIDVDFKSLSWQQDVLASLCVIVLSTLFSFASFRLVEAPLISIRRNRRERQIGNQAAPAAPVRSPAS